MARKRAEEKELCLYESEARVPSDRELVGRISGALAWRIARGEFGK